MEGGGAIFDETNILSDGPKWKLKLPKTGENNFRGHDWLEDSHDLSKFFRTRSCHTKAEFSVNFKLNSILWKRNFDPYIVHA
jgi:hypothetical protein